MPFCDASQSAAMYRTGKPLHGSASLFVFFSLLIYVLSTAFLSAVEGAQASASQRDIKNAQKIVGRFLGNEAGTTWLSGLAKTKSAPLTAEDLMEAILQATRPGGRVWRAASVLSEALKVQTHEGVGQDSIMGRSENWKDLIADIEKEDDIICLYRKNTEETTKKAEDWQKFLRTVSPGYTVHLAIDTGLKYVICLKKIDVPEAMSTETATSPGIIPTTASSPLIEEFRPVTPAQGPMIPERLATIPQSATNIYTKNERSNLKPEVSDESCDDAEGEETKDGKREDIDGEDDAYDEDVDDDEDDDDDDDKDDDEDDDEDDNSVEDERTVEKWRRGMEDDLSAELKYYPVNSEAGWRRPSPFPIGQRNFYLKSRDWPSYPPSGATARFIPETSKIDPECRRPIIVVVQGGNVPMGHQLPLPPTLPVQRTPPPPQLPSIPRIPVRFPELPRPPFHPFVSANNLPRPTKINNSGKPIGGYSAFVHGGGPQQIFPRNTALPYKIRREKMGLAKPVEKPVLQKTRSAVDPKLLDTESRGSPFAQRRPNVIMPRYQILNSLSRRVERLPVADTRGTASPIRRSPGLPQWRQKTPTRNIVISRTGVPYQTDLVRYNFLSRLEQDRRRYILRRSMMNRVDRLAPRVPISKPVSTLIGSRPIRFIVQPLRPLIYGRSLTQETPNVNRELPVRLPLPPVQNINRIYPRLINVLRPVQSIPQIPCTSLNYPVANNFLQTQQRQSMPKVLTPMLQRSPIFYSPCFTPWNRFYPVRNNGPCDRNSHNQLQRYSVACPSPCDRPIKLRIVIQGEVHEPLKVAVLTEPGQRVEIVGTGNPVMPYGSRAYTSGTLARAEPREEEEKVGPEVAEVEERMNYREEERDENEEERSTMVHTSVKGVELENDENSTVASGTEIKSNEVETESNEVQEIGGRFFDEMTIEPTSSADVNSTMSTITNSTLIV